MKSYLAPAEIAEATIEAGIKKASLASSKTLLLGIFAGFFISFGAHADITVMQTFKNIDVGLMKFLGAIVFPVGLMLVLVAGGELFTGNNLMTFALMNKRIVLKDMLRNWSLVYLGNFIGSILFVLAVSASGMYPQGSYMAEMAVSIASSKIALSFGDVFIRGILCNIIVVLAVWMSYSAQDIISKVAIMWFPIMAFVLAGFEHSIANMFFIPMGMASGLDVSWTQALVGNIIPATLGNIVGGAVIVPLVYNFVYLSNKKEKATTTLKKIA